jgi:hypothetical protein
MNHLSLDPNQFKTATFDNRPYFFCPGHPLAATYCGQTGWVNTARHLVSKRLGYWLTASEVIRYLDGNSSNLEETNLKVITRSELMRQNGNWPERVQMTCPVCNLPFDDCPSHAKRRKTCSMECRAILSQHFDVTEEELKILIWQYPTTALGEMWDVSDKAVEKRCKKYGITKPPRGYWALIHSGASHEQALKRLGWDENQIGNIQPYESEFYEPEAIPLGQSRIVLS